MANGNNAPQVTRREFYGAVAVIWLYIMLVLGDLLRIEFRWTTALLWAASIFMMVTYYVITISVGLKSKNSNELLPLSDRVKEIANDPDRKIEAIKVYREETGAGLAEAKEAVEQYVNGAHEPRTP